MMRRSRMSVWSLLFYVAISIVAGTARGQAPAPPHPTPPPPPPRSTTIDKDEAQRAAKEDARRHMEQIKDQLHKQIADDARRMVQDSLRRDFDVLVNMRYRIDEQNRKASDAAQQVMRDAQQQRLNQQLTGAKAVTDILNGQAKAMQDNEANLRRLRAQLEQEQLSNTQIQKVQAELNKLKIETAREVATLKKGTEEVRAWVHETESTTTSDKPAPDSKTTNERTQFDARLDELEAKVAALEQDVTERENANPKTGAPNPNEPTQRSHSGDRPNERPALTEAGRKVPSDNAKSHEETPWEHRLRNLEAGISLGALQRTGGGIGLQELLRDGWKPPEPEPGYEAWFSLGMGVAAGLIPISDAYAASRAGVIASKPPLLGKTQPPAAKGRSEVRKVPAEMTSGKPAADASVPHAVDNSELIKSGEMIEKQFGPKASVGKAAESQVGKRIPAEETQEHLQGGGKSSYPDFVVVQDGSKIRIELKAYERVLSETEAVRNKAINDMAAAIAKQIQARAEILGPTANQQIYIKLTGRQYDSTVKAQVMKKIRDKVIEKVGHLISRKDIYSWD